MELNREKEGKDERNETRRGERVPGEALLLEEVAEVARIDVNVEVGRIKIITGNYKS